MPSEAPRAERGRARERAHESAGHASRAVPQSGVNRPEIRTVRSDSRTDSGVAAALFAARGYGVGAGVASLFAAGVASVFASGATASGAGELAAGVAVGGTLVAAGLDCTATW